VFKNIEFVTKTANVVILYCIIRTSLNLKEASFRISSKSKLKFASWQVNK